MRKQAGDEHQKILFRNNNKNKWSRVILRDNGLLKDKINIQIFNKDRNLGNNVTKKEDPKAHLRVPAVVSSATSTFLILPNCFCFFKADGQTILNEISWDAEFKHTCKYT